MECYTAPGLPARDTQGGGSVKRASSPKCGFFHDQEDRMDVEEWEDFDDPERELIEVGQLERALCRWANGLSRGRQVATKVCSADSS